MHLPLAIHAARQGYAWINQSQHDFTLMERFRKAIGKMPDIDCVEPLSCGALNVAEWVVVYRFMIERGGDFLGRDCLYLSLTYFDRSVASSVHIAKLLELPCFTAPMRDPPEGFDYSLGASQPAPFNPGSAIVEKLASLDFAMAGAAFQNPFDGVLRLTQAEGCPCRVSYEIKTTNLLNPEQVSGREQAHFRDGYEHVADQVPPKKWVRIIVWSAAAVGLLLIAAILDWKNGSTGMASDDKVEGGPVVSRRSLLQGPLKPDMLSQEPTCTDACPWQTPLLYWPGLLELPCWERRVSARPRHASACPYLNTEPRTLPPARQERLHAL